ncbi:MAG TPA: SDR family oxidoreductase [Acidimicrobiales bacterium]|nr:SDR family oxidoreductase [Acidimicrobiales bacterium]
MTVTGPLAGQVALVTGGGSGIGLACAAAFVRDGASVTLAGRTEARLEEAAASLRTADGPAVGIAVCDVAVEDDVQRAVEVAVATGGTGGLDIAVAAAGTGSGGPVLQMDLAAWRAVMAVNLDGAMLTIKHAGGAMAASGGGSIVAISSIAAPLTHRLMSAYCVSKAALEALVRNAADELGAVDVRVNAVRPGLVPTDLAAGLTTNDAIVADYLEQMPIRRLGEVDDVANGVRYLAGPESSWVTGQCVGIDGGHTLRRGPDLMAGFRSTP